MTVEILGVKMEDGPALALTPDEAARVLRVSRTHIYRMLERGELPSFRMGKLRRISVKALQEFIDAAQRT